MTHAIVTGAGGFIGRAVVEQLSRSGVTASRAPRPLDGLARCTEAADVVVHLAASPRHAEIPATARPDVADTEIVLEYCRVQKARCVMASTAGVYDMSAATPQDERSSLEPTNAYAASKLAAERCCREASARFGIPCVVLRLFNVYGPAQRPPFLVPAVVEALVAGQSIGLRMPAAVRDFVFVDDVARAFAAAATRDQPGFRVINVGSGRGTRVSDLVTMVAQLLGCSADWRLSPECSSEIPSSVADIRRARSELCWVPEVTLEQGLKVTCAARQRTPAPR